jgi:hypothetical protein
MPKSAACSDITGLSGPSGPNNCNSPGAPQNTDKYQASAQIYLQAAQTVKQSDLTAAGQAAAAAQYRRAAAAFRLAGDLARAGAAAEQAQALETALIEGAPSSAQGPPVLTPGTDDEVVLRYCANANDVERWSAHYGEICAPHEKTRSVRSTAKACKEKLDILAPHSLNDKWLEDQMKGGAIHCTADGKPIDIRESLKEELAGRPQTEPACPDHYFFSKVDGKSVECSGSWANGRCTYD